MSIFIYILVLFLVIFVVYIDNKTAHFIDSAINVRNIPVDYSTQVRKKVLYDNEYNNPFLNENDFLIWNDSLEFRNDIVTSKNTYTPNYLESILKPFAQLQKYNDKDFFELKNGTNVDIDRFLLIVDNVMNMFSNAIYFDLFKNPDRPQNIMCPNINMCYVKLLNKKIVRVRKNADGLYKWDIVIELTLYNKAFSYGILCIVEDNTLINLRVIGIRSEDLRKLQFNYKRDPQIMITQDEIFPFVGKNYYRFNENTDVLIEKNVKKKVNEYLSRQQFTPSGKINFKHDTNKQYSCHGSHGRDKTECENNYDTYFIKKNRGVWDKHCMVDNECPFFKANKNYSNVFGGCIDGFCEMPIGIKRLSPRFYDISSTPSCYNCNGNNNNCCDTQENPDYMFEGDILVRKANEYDLIERGLELT